MKNRLIVGELFSERNSQNMNDLFIKQNNVYFQELLTTQHFVYRLAKRINYLCYVFSILFPIAISILLIWFTDEIFVAVCAFTSIILMLLSHLLSYLVEKYKNDAAMIQQLFDCELYDISSHFDIDIDIINEYLVKYKNKEYNRKNNWYSDYSKLPKNKAIFMCQKENVDWTTRTSKTFIVTLCIVLCLSLIPIIVGFIVSGYTLPKLLSYIMIISPFASFLISSIFSVTKENKTVYEMEIKISNCFELLKQNVLTDDRLEQLQTYIYLYRKEKFLIPEFFDKLFYKKNKEIQDQKSRNIK